MLLPLSDNQIDLWLVFPDEIHEPDLLATYRRFCTDDERRREQRFHFAKHRHQHLLTRALVRTVLSRYAAVRPEDWRFADGSHGRPEILNERCDLRFNVSHTEGLILCGVTRAGEVGVDTENIRTRRSTVDIAERFFAPDECAALRRLPATEQPDRFFDYWVLKESYIKARSQGLSLPLDQFSFHFPDREWIRVDIQPTLADYPERWRFWLFRPSPDHVAAVCLQRSREQSERVVVRKVVPLRSEEPFSCAIERDSAPAK